MIETVVKGVDVRLETSPLCFSPNAVDAGTLAMLSQVDFAPDDRVLDLGCGYGVVGIVAARLVGDANVVMSDIDRHCVELSRKNALLNGVGGVTVLESDGLDDVPHGDFTLILSNPPYHADFSVPRRFIEKGFNRLRIGGKMLMVTKRRDWYKNKLVSIFGGVKIHEIDGYHVFTAEKRSNRYAKTR